MPRILISRSVALFLFVAALMALGADASAQDRRERRLAEEAVRDAVRAYNQRDYRTAVDKFAASFAVIPVNPEAHFFKASSHYNLKEFDKALAEFDLALSQGYKPVLNIYKVRWFVKYELKDFDGALADIREGLKLEPNNLMFLVGHGEIQFSRGNYREALQAYQLALVREPQNADLYYHVAATHARLNSLNEQISSAEEAIKRNTRLLGDAYYLAAQGYYAKRRYVEAEQAYNRAIDRWKANRENKQEKYFAYRALADIYRNLNRFNDAISISKQALIDYPNDATIYTDISWYYSLADRHKEAVEAGLAGVQLKPTEYLAHTNLCRAYNDVGEYQRAISTCNNALRLKPDDGETFYYLGRANDLLGGRSEQAGRQAEAKRYFQEATRFYERAVVGLEKYTQENREYSDGFYLLGNAYFANNQRAKAIGAYQRALDLSPRFVKARYNLGIIQTLEKNRAAAMEQYNSLLPLDPALAAKLKGEIDKM